MCQNERCRHPYTCVCEQCERPSAWRAVAKELIEAIEDEGGRNKIAAVLAENGFDATDVCEALKHALLRGA